MQKLNRSCRRTRSSWSTRKAGAWPGYARRIGPLLPPAGRLNSAAEAYAHGKALGAMVKAAGFTMTAAPVLDLSIAGASGVIGDRAITGGPEQVALLGGEIARGIMDEGILPVMKHIPGHGRALLDSHLALPHVAVNDEDDHLPFIRNKDLPWAMTAHIVYEQWDSERRRDHLADRD